MYDELRETEEKTKQNKQANQKKKKNQPTPKQYVRKILNLK